MQTDNKLYYICKYTPLEILAACGAECELIDYFPQDHSCAECHVHKNICGFGKSIIDAVYEKNIKRLVLVNCCDSVRSVYEALRAGGGLDFIYLMDLPYKNDEGAVKILNFEIDKLITAYCKFSGGAFSVKLFNIEPRKNEVERNPYIAILGSRVGKRLENYIGKTLNMEVRNMTCTNLRGLTPFDFEKKEDLIFSYCKSLLSQTPCLRMASLSSRESLYEDKNLRAVVYATVQFCDFYGFEYARLREKTSLPLLKIETDYTDSAKGQLETRTEAFREQLKSLEVIGEKGEKMNKAKAFNDGYYAGIDVGSTSVDVVIMDGEKRIISSAIHATEALLGVEAAFNEAMKKAGINKDEITCTVTTGYGRKAMASANGDITEISCHAKGARFLNPLVKVILDIGGQDSKAISLDDDGNLLRFVMNDKCAAGTGRFLEIMAGVLGLSLEEISEKGLKSRENIVISNMCTVFAESEVISLVSQGESVENIVWGLDMSVAKKAASLIGRINEGDVVMMTGGVAANKGVVSALEKVIGKKVITDKFSQYCGAIGAALYAAEM